MLHIRINHIRGHALVGGSLPAVRLPTAHTHHHLLLRVLGLQNPVTAFSFVCVLLICTQGLTFAEQLLCTLIKIQFQYELLYNVYLNLNIQHSKVTILS